MAVETLNYYILFENYTQGLALYDLLKEAGLRSRIAPTPRQVQGELSCGMSLLVSEADIGAVRAFLEGSDAAYVRIAELAGQIRPGRDRYC